MKMQKVHNKEWNSRHSYNSLRRKIYSKLKRKNNRRRSIGLTEINRDRCPFPPRYFVRKLKERRIDVPEILSFSHNYDEVLAFIIELQRLVFEERRSLFLNFCNIREVSAGACLVLVAEIDRWRRVYGFNPAARYLEKWRPSVLRLLDQMGFFDVLDVSNRSKEEERKEEDRVFVKFISHEEVLGSAAKSLKECLYEVAEVTALNRSLYDALVEAMQNVIHHAYNKTTECDPRKLHNRWWMTGSFVKSTRKLSVIFYDLGVGIPKTLPSKYGSEILRGFFSDLGLVNNDANIIYAAMELGRSGTGQRHRGKGLPQMRELVDQFYPGQLRILSGHGELTYSSTAESAGGKGAYTRRTHSMALEGTLIQWDIFLPQDSDEVLLI